ncbi:Conserved_hypothetical protein [Hexamita inflata]|uniref:Uncharacterized protein n=1 Tax=Hexamita inflata TaxID=28002 RepID=A0AA86N4R7_9EUKA|nr:Conserved hypothetical protein [Hexamita inflata]
MNLQGQSGQEIQLTYDDGEWQLTSLESTKEIRRLQKENDALKTDNEELNKQLKKALRLAAVLQLDLQRLTQQAGQSIKFSNEQTRKEFMETSPEELISKRLMIEK